MIFISYRIKDAVDIVDRLDADLTREFGAENVFRDKTRVRVGEKWSDQLTESARSCKVMLVVMGLRWQTDVFTDGDQKGFPRLSDPEDWVRKEITLSLEARRAIVPVFLNGVLMPPQRWLAHCGLERLHDYQGVPLRSDDYSTDLARLVIELRKVCPDLPLERADRCQAKRWSPAVRHPLQPAPLFAGREDLLKNLAAWTAAPDDTNRVVALVAAGGTGKTALAERVLGLLAKQSAAGVFVWSFYENPQTESFLRAACEYFLGEAPKETGGLLERLQQGLEAENLPHLLILDGLELVQATGASGRPRGGLEDPLMRRFLRWLAGAQSMRTKALITSRFPLPDLEDWNNNGFLAHELEDLDPIAARSVLRKRGVKGDDRTLNALADSVHRHALTVDVLGLYLHRFGNDAPRNAARFELKSFANQQKAERLTKVLSSYAAKLPSEERDLLARLSLFPRGVTVEYLGFIIAAGKKIAGSLVRYDHVRLLDMLESLRELGLVFRSETREGCTYSAHPFLRDFFRGLLGKTKPEQVHEAVRKNLALSLVEKPENHPTDPADLDRYERLIELTLLAKRTQEAFDLYYFRVGGFEHLGEVLGDHARGLRVISQFPTEYASAEMDLSLSRFECTAILSDRGRFATRLGDLKIARQSFMNSSRLCRDFNDILTLAISSENECDVALMAGQWPIAREAATAALQHAQAATNEKHVRYSHARLGASLFGLGQVDAASKHFSKAGTPLYWYPSVWRAEFRLAMGDRLGSGKMIRKLQDASRHHHWYAMDSVCDAFLGLCAVTKNPGRARAHHTIAHEYASRCGDVEVTLRCRYLAAVIARREREFQSAITEAEKGIDLADSCEFGRWSLDIRTELATIYLAAGNPNAAIKPADWVLKRSRESDCQYAWGSANSLHLLGVAYRLLGDSGRAIDYLQQAIEKRKLLQHPGLKDTKEELRKLEEK